MRVSFLSLRNLVPRTCKDGKSPGDEIVRCGTVIIVKHDATAELRRKLQGENSSGVSYRFVGNLKKCMKYVFIFQLKINVNFVSSLPL